MLTATFVKFGQLETVKVVGAAMPPQSGIPPMLMRSSASQSEMFIEIGAAEPPLRSSRSNGQPDTVNIPRKSESILTNCKFGWFISLRFSIGELSILSVANVTQCSKLRLLTMDYSLLQANVKVGYGSCPKL